MHSLPDNLDDAPSLAELLTAEAVAIKLLDAEVLDATDMGTHAIAWALQGIPVFPLRGKNPAVRNPHPPNSPERANCKGECGQLGHGVHDATTDLPTIVAWWSTWARGLNIGGHVPENVVVVDVDPRHGGDQALAELERKHGRMPDVFGEISGRGDGGRHYWFRRPPGTTGSAGRPAGCPAPASDKASTSRRTAATSCCRRQFTPTPASRT